MWTTGPRRHVTDLYVDHRTHVGHRTTKACDRPRCGPQDQHMATEHTYMWNTPTGLLHTNTEQDQPCGPLYKDRWTNTLNKTRSCEPPHNSDMLCGLLQNNTEQDQDMWTTLQLGQVMWTATRPGHVDFLTRTCGPLYPN